MQFTWLKYVYIICSRSRQRVFPNNVNIILYNISNKQSYPFNTTIKFFFFYFMGKVLWEILERKLFQIDLLVYSNIRILWEFFFASVDIDLSKNIILYFPMQRFRKSSNLYIINPIVVHLVCIFQECKSTSTIRWKCMSPFVIYFFFYLKQIPFSTRLTAFTKRQLTIWLYIYGRQYECFKY